MGKKYFFLFIDNAIKMTMTYTKTKKSNRLKFLKIYHSLSKTLLKENHLIKKLKSDYGLKLQSYKANKWMLKENIRLRLFVLYTQKQNNVSKQIKKTIMNINKVTIFETFLNNNL